MWWFACTHPPARTEPTPFVETPLVTRYPDATLRSVFGVNEPVSLPKKFARDLALDARHERVDQALEKLAWMGVSAVRLHSATYPYLSWYGQTVEQNGDTAPADQFLSRVIAAGLDPLVMIGPWPGNEPRAFTERYLPDDVDGYTAWVTATVERYDGDGVGDAAGIGRGIRRWEVDNEPDLHNSAPPKSNRAIDPSKFSTPDEYRRIYQVTVDAIHAADPQAEVLPAGLWRPFDARSQDYAARLGDLGAVNLHGYPRRGLADLWTGVDALARPDRPLWITETSTSALESERSQAIDLASLWLEAIRRDVRTVYWHALTEAPDLYDNPPRPGVARGRHLFTGYPDDVGPRRAWRQTHPRVAAWALRNLILRYGDAPRSEVVAIPAPRAPTPGVHALRIGADTLIWSELGHTAAGVVDWPAVKAVEITRLIPDGADGGAIATPRFPTRTGGPGWVRIDLADGPVALHPRP
jgi:hypothetical protein